MELKLVMGMLSIHYADCCYYLHILHCRAHSSQYLSWNSVEYLFPNFPDVKEVSVDASDRDHILDLRPYVDSAAYSIRENASIQRAYRMFRTLGLRHLCITDKRNKILGIVTRVDLVSSHVDKCTNSKNRNNRKVLQEINNLFQEDDDDL